jgi:hypothetical protein
LHVGLMKLGPRVEQVTETGVKTRYPECTPGCCPFRSSAPAQ